MGKCGNRLNMGIGEGEVDDPNVQFTDPVCELESGHFGEHVDRITRPGQELRWLEVPYCRMNPAHLDEGRAAVVTLELGPPLGEVDACQECWDRAEAARSQVGRPGSKAKGWDLFPSS